ncbi:LacI family DNA-binding transcriptional regulator [Demequina oxidasica]|uniref:LacI family DNA-binding transcriptional regulator n=1 Tax=Demequina oxidasica TaxID=676199 RepID=UPI0034E2E6B7
MDNVTISLKDVAVRAGVSSGTVSNVLNRPDRVKAATVERVNRAIADLGYVPNAAARQLRAGQSTSLGLIVLDVGNPFFTDLAKGAERAAADVGLSVLLANSDESSEREDRYLDLFETQRVAGVLISPVSDDLPRLHRLRARGIPVVLVDRGATDSDFPSVSVDDVAGGRIATEHLIAIGRTKIAFVGGPLRIRQVADRYRGACDAVEAAGRGSVEYIETSALTLAAGQTAGARVGAGVRTGRFDAIFAANDLVALGVQQALLSGPEPLSIPRDVALVGYDDISFAAAAVVPVTSVRQPRELIGSTAVELLLGDIGEERDSQQVVFQPELVVRESTAAAAT